MADIVVDTVTSTPTPTSLPLPPSMDIQPIDGIIGGDSGDPDNAVPSAVVPSASPPLTPTPTPVSPTPTPMPADITVTTPPPVVVAALTASVVVRNITQLIDTIGNGDTGTGIVASDADPAVPPNTVFGVDLEQYDLDFAGGPEIEAGFSIFLIVFGLMFMLFGTRTFKPSLTVCAFVLSAAAGFYITLTLSEKPVAAMITGGLVGIAVTVLVLKVWSVAIFAVGAGTGFVAWVGFNALFPGLLATDVLFYGVLAGACLVCGGLSLMAEKWWILIGSSLIGAFFAAQGIDHFLDEDLSVFAIISHEGSCVQDSCYALYSSVFGAAALSAVIQYRYTSEWAEERRKEADAAADARDGDDGESVPMRQRGGKNDFQRARERDSRQRALQSNTPQSDDAQRPIVVVVNNDGNSDDVDGGGRGGRGSHARYNSATAAENDSFLR